MRALCSAACAVGVCAQVKVKVRVRVRVRVRGQQMRSGGQHQQAEGTTFLVLGRGSIKSSRTLW